MSLLLKILATFGLGAVNIVVAIPAGVLTDLPYLLAILIAGGGAISSVLVVALIGGWVREKFLAGVRGRRMQLVMKWVTEATDKYGLVGFGLVAPLLLGIPVAAAFAAASGMRRSFILVAMGGWILFWAMVFWVVFSLNLAGVYSFTTRI